MKSRNPAKDKDILIVSENRSVNILDSSEKFPMRKGKTEAKIIETEISEGGTKKEKIDNNLIFEKKHISIFKLYCHISGGLEIFLSIIAIIMTIGAGCSNAIMNWIFGDSSNSFTLATTMEKLKEILDKELFNEIFNYIMEELVEPSINDQIKKLLIVGAVMTVCNFLMMFLWSYLSLRQLHWLKKNYFRIILNQEQAWFDENNAFEFATKVQAQLEQIELGLGDRLGQFIMMVVELISGFVVAFIASWKLTLILITCFPFIIAGALIMTFTLKKIITTSRKTYEIAGGVAEELLYNIKTVTSFTNFDYEMNRFGHLINLIELNDENKSFFSGLSVGIIIFGIFFGYTVTLLYARKLIMKHLEKQIIAIESLDYYELLEENEEISIGEIQKVLFSIIASIQALGQIAPVIQVIRAACEASSDYFTLLKREPEIYVSEKNLEPDRDTINGKIEFKNIKFIYPGDITQKPVLNDLNLEIDAGKKVAFVGESGCGKVQL